MYYIHLHNFGNNYVLGEHKISFINKYIKKKYNSYFTHSCVLNIVLYFITKNVLS